MKLPKIDWVSRLLELAVVFIGITLALLLNNWNDERKAAQLELKYISGFHTDIEGDISELASVIEENEGHLQSLGWLSERLKSRSFQPDTLMYLIYSMTTFALPGLNDITYESITNSGSLTSISDYDLRNAIIAYYKLYEGKSVVEDLHREYVFQHVTPILAARIDFSTSSIISAEDLTRLDFTNVVFGERITLQQLVEHYRVMLEQARLLKARLP